MTGLTDDEREMLRVACGFMRNRNVETVTQRIKADAVAAARAEVLAKVEALADSLTPPVNCELRYDGSTDTHMAAWVEGRLDAIDALRALVADLGGDHG